MIRTGKEIEQITGDDLLYYADVVKTSGRNRREHLLWELLVQLEPAASAGEQDGAGGVVSQRQLPPALDCHTGQPIQHPSLRCQRHCLSTIWERMQAWNGLCLAGRPGLSPCAAVLSVGGVVGESRASQYTAGKRRWPRRRRGPDCR